MVTITDDMRNTSRKAMAELERRTDRAIRLAVECGHNRAVFPLDHTDSYFNQLKELYERNGYKIVPVGALGGVYQRDYYIMW